MTRSQSQRSIAQSQMLSRVRVRFDGNTTTGMSDGKSARSRPPAPAPAPAPKSHSSTVDVGLTIYASIAPGDKIVCRTSSGINGSSVTTTRMVPGGKNFSNVIHNVGNNGECFAKWRVSFHPTCVERDVMVTSFSINGKWVRFEQRNIDSASKKDPTPAPAPAPTTAPAPAPTPAPTPAPAPVRQHFRAQKQMIAAINASTTAAATAIAAASVAISSAASVSVDNDDGIISNSWRTVSLLCAYTQSRMDTPAKTVRCKHPACWNLQAYKNSNFTACPAFGCNVKNIKPCEVYAELELTRVLKDVPPDINRIEYTYDSGDGCGRWRLPENGRYNGKRKVPPSIDAKAKPGCSSDMPICIDSDSD
jgi:hypothetical protein